MKKILFILAMTCLFVVLPVLINNAFPADVTLQWDANTEPDLAGYKVYYGTSPGQYGDPIILDTVTEYTMHMPDDIMYFFMVTAFDQGNNESDPSNEVFCINDIKPGVVIQLIIKCN